MAETRGITFRKLKENCDWKTLSHNHCYKLVDVCKKDKCTAANCPIWKGLKKEG